MKITYQATNTVKVTGATLAVNAVAYADHDLVGGLLTLANPFGEGVGFVLNSITLQDLDADNACPLVVLLFEENPASTTFTNNSIVNLADADVPKVTLKVKIAASDYDAIGTTNMIAEVSNLGLAMRPSGKYFYVANMCDGATPTWAASDVSLTFGLIGDAA
jgi:hypothetical protein